jgi:hypothetical protein
MKRHTGAGQANGEREVEEALAVLISCTRTKRRPLPLTEVADWIELAVSKLGSHAAVADRIGLSTKMLRQFSAVQRLSKPVQRLFQSRQLDSVDAAAHLAMLPAGEQELVAEELASGLIDTGDLRAVVQLWQTGGSGPLRTVLRKVKESKTRHVYVAEFVVRGPNDRERVQRALQKYIEPAEIIGVELEGSLGRAMLSREGKKQLSRAAKDLGASLRGVVSRILKG